MHTRRWTVWDNKEQKLVVKDGTAPECAEAMGVAIGTFYRNARKSLDGREVRWHIIPMYAANVKGRRWYEVMGHDD